MCGSGSRVEPQTRNAVLFCSATHAASTHAHLASRSRSAPSAIRGFDSSPRLKLRIIKHLRRLNTRESVESQLKSQQIHWFQCCSILFGDVPRPSRARMRGVVTLQQFVPSIRIWFVRYCSPICYARAYAWNGSGTMLHCSKKQGKTAPNPTSGAKS